MRISASFGKCLATWMALVAAAAAVVSCSQQPPAQPAAARPPDLSGFWNLSRPEIPLDERRVATLPNDIALIKDTGVTELPIGDYGGLRVKPEALKTAQAWKPEDDMTISKACSPPSIIYAMQGPFPFEILQGTELIVIKMEYFDLVRIIFMDGRKPDPQVPHSKTGFSVGRWEDSTLVVETTHLSPSTIMNNGLDHSADVKVTERFTLLQDGNTLEAIQIFEDPKTLDNRGMRYITWRRDGGQHVFPYECDPSFGANYGTKQ
jgi:hypothetical protein